jgi:LETM1 and EF-hand domain-containing protein 1
MSLWLPRSSSSAQLLRYRYRSQHLRIITLYHTARTDRRLAQSRFQSTKTPPQSTTVLSDSSIPSDPKPSPPAPRDVTSQSPFLSRAWKKVKHEAAHYWHGTKLLVSEIRISARLQWKILHGESLTRRERRQVRVYLSFLRVHAEDAAS